MKHIGNQIREYRKRKGLTQVQLAKKINKSIDSVKRYENGTRQAPITVLEQIASALDIQLNEILSVNDQAEIIFNEFIEEQHYMNILLERTEGLSILHMINKYLGIVTKFENNLDVELLKDISSYYSFKVNELNKKGLCKIKTIQEGEE